MSEQELQPCPFCGADAELIHASPSSTFSENPCCSCENSCSEGVDIETWNTRPLEDQLRAENKKLCEDIDQIARFYESLGLDDVCADLAAKRLRNVLRESESEVSDGE